MWISDKVINSVTVLITAIKERKQQKSFFILWFFKYVFVRHTSWKQVPHHLVKKKKTDVHFQKESHHILPGQISSAFQTGFLPTALTQSSAISVHWKSPSSIWTHASIYFGLHCSHPAWGLITFAQSRGPPLSPFERPHRHNGRKENMLRFEHSDAFNCDLLVSVMNTQGSQKVFKKCTAHEHIYT